MQLCKHEPHRIIDDIRAPKWSTDEVLIDTQDVKGYEHVLLRFSDPSPKKKYGWFYMSGKMIRSNKTQPNGRIRVYVVPMSKREPLEVIKACLHQGALL